MMYKKSPSGAKRLRVLGLVPAVLVAAAICSAPPISSTIRMASIEKRSTAKRETADKVTKLSPTTKQLVTDKMQLPSYPGGMEAMYRFLLDNLRYPEEAMKAGRHGRVIIGCTIETDGSISDVEVRKGVASDLDAEAIRAIKAMPRWNPGVNESGEPVRCVYVIPVSFELKNEDKTPIKKRPTTNDKMQLPSYPGGMDAMVRFLLDNLRYPEEAMKAGRHGRVIVGCTIEADGSISDITVRKGVAPDLDAEAIRAIKSMPRWIPGVNESGEPVRCTYAIPVSFELKDNDKK